MSKNTFSLYFFLQYPWDMLYAEIKSIKGPIVVQWHTCDSRLERYFPLRWHSYFTWLNLKKMALFWICLPVFLGNNWNHKQKYFFNFCEELVTLRAIIIGHSHPGPFWKMAKMALFNPWIKFEKFSPKAFIRSAKKVIFEDFVQNVSRSAYPSG